MTSQLSPIKLQRSNQRLQAELTELRSRYESLQKSEARYRQIFENAPISLLCISTEGEPIEMNSAAEQFLGWTIADANEAGFNVFTDPTLVENGTISSIKRAIAGETVIEPPMFYEPSSTIGQGQWKWAQGHYYPIRDAAGQVQEIIEVALDLTAMYEVQQKLASERTRLLKATAQVANLLLRTSDYTTVLPDVVRLLGSAVECDRCGIGQSLVHPISGLPAVRIAPEWCRKGVRHSEEFSPHSNRLFLWNNDAPYIYQQLLQSNVVNSLVDDLPEPDRSLLAAQENTAELFVPILVNQQLWGYIAFDSCGKPRLYDEGEIAVLKVAAESIAAAIARQAQDDALRKSERCYRTLFELSSEGILRFGYHQPIPLSLSVDEQLELCYRSIYIAESNEAFAKMYEYENAEDLIGLTLDDFHDRDSEVTQATMRAYVEDKHSARTTETVEVDRYGRKRYFLNSSVSTIENDRVVSTWVSQIDITELREAQQALLKAEQERAQKLGILNTELQQAVDSLEARDRILAATAKASNVLLTGEDLDEAVNKALQIIGETIDTDRVGIIENFENPSDPSYLYWKMIYEWDSAYADPQINHPELAQGSYEGIEEWYELFDKGQTISYQLEEMSEPFRSGQVKLGLKTFNSVPIFIKGKYWGNVGIDDCREATHRSEAELSILKTAAACIGGAIERDRTRKTILQAEQERVAELAKTNQALKNSLDRLADEPDLDAFLGHVLTETSQQLQIDLGYLFFYDPCDRTLDLHMQVTPAGTSLKHELEPNNPFCKSFSVEDLPIWDTLLETQKPFIIDRQNAAQYVFQGTLEWQTQPQEHQAGINILLTLGDEPIGLFALVSTKRSFSPQEIELAQALAQQATLAIQLTRLAEEAKQSAIIGERNRLAGEIHDTLAQTFTGISVQLELAQYLSQHNPTEVESILARIGSLAQTGLAEARRSVWSIYSARGEYTDLAQKLADCIEYLTLGTKIDAHVNTIGDPYPLSYFIGKNLLRIGQESITNALKHSQATEIQVKLTYTPDQVGLCISDNGCGFCLQNQTEGFGLIGISERCDRIGGQLRITTELEQGTEIFVQVSP